MAARVFRVRKSTLQGLTFPVAYLSSVTVILVRTQSKSLVYVSSSLLHVCLFDFYYIDHRFLAAVPVQELEDDGRRCRSHDKR